MRNINGSIRDGILIKHTITCPYSYLTLLISTRYCIKILLYANIKSSHSKVPQKFRMFRIQFHGDLHSVLQLKSDCKTQNNLTVKSLLSIWDRLLCWHTTGGNHLAQQQSRPKIPSAPQFERRRKTVPTLIAVLEGRFPEKLLLLMTEGFGKSF